MRKILLAAAAAFALIAPALAQRALITPSVSFTRPSDTITYTIGDGVLNSTTTASALAMPFTLSGISGQGTYVRRALIKKTTTGVVAPNFRLHLFTSQPLLASGDNTPLSITTSTGYFCSIDVNMFTTTPFLDGNYGIGAPNSGSECAVLPPTTLIYGVMEARGAYVPGSAEVFTVTLEAYTP